MANQPARPLSPHLQIYKLPLGAKLSITHRFTGLINSLAFVLLVWVLASAAGPDTGSAEHTPLALSIMGSWFGYLLMFVFSATLYYHLCNGIRHLFWDAGHGFELEEAHRSGLIVLVAAGALTLITWLVALAS